MADYTPSYAANIAVRAFLTKITEMLLCEVFNHRRVDVPEGAIRIYGAYSTDSTVVTRESMLV
jgi:hypothetical protein